MAAFFAVPALGGTHSGARTDSAVGRSAEVRPAAVPSAGVTTAVSILSHFTNYTILPYTMEIHIAVTGASIATNASLWVTVTDVVTSKYCTTGSLNFTVADGFTFYNLSLNPVTMGGVTFANCPTIESDPVILNATVLAINNSTGTPVSNMTWTTVETSLVYAPLSVSLLIPTGDVGAGNISLVAQYSAQYVQSVRMLIYSTSGAALLFNSSLQWPNSVSPAVGIWFESAPGVYPFHLVITTNYGSFTRLGNITVLAPGGGTVYSNTSTWTNASIFSGVSGAVSGTILLVVGLIVGMIVALVVGRSIMRPAAVAPAQQWQPGAAPANTCSVCGKSFATPEELKEHAKTEHGIT